MRRATFFQIILPCNPKSAIGYLIIGLDFCKQAIMNKCSCKYTVQGLENKVSANFTKFWGKRLASTMFGTCWTCASKYIYLHIEMHTLYHNVLMYVFCLICCTFSQVVNTRLSDSIPQTIRLDLYEKFVKAINKKILHSLFNEDTTLIDEDTETTARRKELQEKICSLKNVIARLKNFNGWASDQTFCNAHEHVHVDFNSL